MSLVPFFDKSLLLRPSRILDNCFSRIESHCIMQSESEKKVTTDVVDEEKKPKHKTGKGSRQRSAEQFRKKKNKETDDAIQAGIFARLKISDPTSIPTIPIASEVHPVTVPIKFNVLPEYVVRIWDTMEAIATRPFGILANLDVQQLKPEEISVKVTDNNTITIEGKHEEKKDEHGWISRHFVRKYVLPENCDINKVQSKLSSDGVLTVIAPKKDAHKKLKHKSIPIERLVSRRKRGKLKIRSKGTKNLKM